MAQTTSPFPEGADLEQQITNRHRRGTLGRVLFQAATIVGILALTALLYNILNQTFGLTAVQNEVDPDALVLALDEEKMLAASNTVTSEDDNDLVAGIENDPYAIGFFGYAYYLQNQDRLKVLDVENVTPSRESAESGDYLLARPLYLYTTADILQNNQAVSIFVNYYLSHLNEVVAEVGYFPLSQSALYTVQDVWAVNSGLGLTAGQWTTIDPNGLRGVIRVAGSSTVFPITEAMAVNISEAGFNGNINLESTGTTAGFRAFCRNNSQVDVVNASRPINAAEFEACRDAGLRPLALAVAIDALAVVVSQENSFLGNVTQEELRQIYTTAERWSDVDPSWPDEPIRRYIPGADSGTLDFFTETIFQADLADLPKDDLVEILQANISVGLGRRLERDQRFYEDQFVFEDPVLFAEVCASAEPPTGCELEARSEANVYQLVLAEVVKPDVVKTWSLVDSLFKRREITQLVAEDYPNAELEFRSWLTGQFVASPQSSTPELAGVRTAIMGSLWIIVITIVFSFPIGVGAAIYLQEYATDNWVNRLIETNISNLAGVPSIIYGMLGLAIFVRVLEPITSGAAFGLVDSTASANGRTIISAGLTLGLLILPLLIINAQEAIKAVPNSLRQAGMALGATKWQTIWHHVLPNALPGIMTGTILAISRAIGETAPIVVVGASTFITVDPDGPFAKFTTLPIQIYQWTSRPQDEFRNIAAAAIVVLLILLLSLNASAVILRNRTTRRLS